VLDYISVPLNASHKRESFTCGNTSLDDYLHKQAKQDIKRRLTACFVMAGEKGVIKGYYTLSADRIPRKDLPEAMLKKMPPAYTGLPVTLLGRLAVDHRYQGQGIGKALLLDSLKRAVDASSNVGSMAVIVDPFDKEAEVFYAAFDFIRLPVSGRMFLLMKTIAGLF
jgi:GNAT superfamily N-acetyltransferase